MVDNSIEKKMQKVRTLKKIGEDSNTEEEVPSRPTVAKELRSIA